MNSRFAITICALGLSLTACSTFGARPSASPDPTATSAPSTVPSVPAATTPSPTAPTPSPTAPTPAPSAATPAPSAPGTDGPSGLDGREFVSVLVTNDGASVALVPGTRVRIGFSNNMLSASAGCNNMSGHYDLDGSRLVVGQLATTAIGCPRNLADQDTWLSDFLVKNPTIALDGNDLVLTSDKTEMTLMDREQAEPDQPLVGITWTLSTILNGDLASSVPTGVMATLLFDGDGQFTFNDGCNSGGGQYTVNGDKLELAQVVSTQMACTGDKGDVQAAVHAVLGADSITFAIDHTTLSLHADADPHALQYDAAVDVTD